MPSTCTIKCGDGIVVSVVASTTETAEGCDDGNAAGVLTGCKSDCSAEDVGYDCTFPGNLGKSTCTPVCEVAGPTYPITGDFECNDGNNVATDGCNGCIISSGWACDITPNPAAVSTCA